MPGVPANPTPAQVINLSLGEQAECAPGYQQVIASRRWRTGSRGRSSHRAGNDGDADVATNTPSNCPGVISVGACPLPPAAELRTGNFGATMTISAPGGDTFGRSDGIEILSNLGHSVPTTDGLDVGNGTSYAAPMVSGVISLMLAVAPGLSASQVRAILASSAKPLPSGLTAMTATCGAGIVDVHAAVQAARRHRRVVGEFRRLVVERAARGSESGWGINFAHQGDHDLRLVVHLRSERARHGGW